MREFYRFEGKCKEENHSSFCRETIGKVHIPTFAYRLYYRDLIHKPKSESENF